MQWKLFFCYILSLVVVYLCIKKGVEFSGKVAIYTATGPYVLLTVLLIRGLFLDGAMDGLYYLFKPNLSKIFDFNVWVSAGSKHPF